MFPDVPGCVWVPPTLPAAERRTRDPNDDSWRQTIREPMPPVLVLRLPSGMFPNMRSSPRRADDPNAKDLPNHLRAPVHLVVRGELSCGESATQNKANHPVTGSDLGQVYLG